MFVICGHTFIRSTIWGINFSTDGSILFCKICKVRVAGEKKFTVTQHVSRVKYMRALEIQKNIKGEVVQTTDII